MTNTKAANVQGIFGPSRRTRPGSTVRAEWLMEEAQRLAMGKRIAQLRERSPYTQPQVAEKMGYESVRGYQKLEARGTTKHERCEELAEIHSWTRDAEGWEHINADWIWDGRMPKGATPDPFPADPYAEQLDRIEEKLDEILERLTDEDAESTGGGGPLPDPGPLEPSRPPTAPSKDAPPSRREERRRRGE